MNVRSKAWLQMHVCVLLWGATAIFGRLITLPAIPLVFWRMAIVSGTLALLPGVRGGWRRMTPRLRLAYAGIGALLAIHWLTFYVSIKIANASVGATCMALAPIFLALGEPAIAGRRFEPRELLLAAASVPGVALVVGGIPGGMRTGFAVGTVSALLLAVFGALNKRFVEAADALSITGLEIGTGALLVAILAPLFPHQGPALPIPGARDAIFLFVLAYACTVIPFSLALVALRHISAFGAQLVVNLEAVYAAILAALLLGEHRELGLPFYAGAAIILLTVAALPLVSRRR